jgi:hypothetical protein
MYMSGTKGHRRFIRELTRFACRLSISTESYSRFSLAAARACGGPQIVPSHLQFGSISWSFMVSVGYHISKSSDSICPNAGFNQLHVLGKCRMALCMQRTFWRPDQDAGLHSLKER